jgi:hypothetical protein
MEKNYYVVIYKADNTIEGLLQSEKDFGKWLKEHNSMRDDEPEKKDEFELKRVTLFMKHN